MSMSVAPPAQVEKVGSTTSGSEVPSRSSSKAWASDQSERHQHLVVPLTGRIRWSW